MKRKTFVRELKLYASESFPSAMEFILAYEKRFKSTSAEFDQEQKKKRKKYKLPKVFNRNTYEIYLKSEVWRKIRKRVLEIRGKKCEGCGSIFRLNVHHSIYSPSILNGESLDGLRVVCKDCHKLIHKFEDSGMTLIKATLEVIENKNSIGLVANQPIIEVANEELVKLKKMAKRIK